MGMIEYGTARTKSLPNGKLWVESDPNGNLPSAHKLSSLSSGIVKHLNGVPSVAVAGTDYADASERKHLLLSQIRSRLALTAGTPLVGFHEDFCKNPLAYDNGSEWGSNINGGGATGTIAAGDRAGGAISIAAAAVTSQIQMLNAAVGSVRSVKSAIYGAFRLPNAATGTTVGLMGVIGAGGGFNTVSVGYRQSLHASQFIMQYNGSLTGSFAALATLDTLWHKFMVVFDGADHATVYWDDESTGTQVTLTSTYNAGRGLPFYVQNCTGMSVDYYGIWGVPA